MRRLKKTPSVFDRFFYFISAIISLRGVIHCLKTMNTLVKNDLENKIKEAYEKNCGLPALGFLTRLEKPIQEIK